MADATKVTQAEFARMQGWSRSHVTGLKQAGRLVMSDSGKRVLVKESLARIEATKDPNRDDVAKRHEENRHEENRQADARDDEQPEDLSDEHGIPPYQRSRARKEFYLGLQAQADLEERLGELIKRDDVDRAFYGQWKQMCISMDHLRDQISAELTTETDQDVIHAMLGEHFERLQSELYQNLKEKS